MTTLTKDINLNIWTALVPKEIKVYDKKNKLNLAELFFSRNVYLYPLTVKVNNEVYFEGKATFSI